MIQIVQALVAAVEEGDVLWPGIGVFHLIKSRRMPGFPRTLRLGFKLSPHLFRALNEGRPPPSEPGEGSTDWITDPEATDAAVRMLTEEIQRRSRVVVPGLGTFEIERRELGGEDQFFAKFRTDPSVLRSLNPKDEAYDKALAAEWPDGPPTGGQSIEA